MHQQQLYFTPAVAHSATVAHVQVSRTPAVMTWTRARRPASEKRQGTKSRGVGHSGGAGAMGI